MWPAYPVASVAPIDAVMHRMYDVHMRTTISLEDRLAERVKRRAVEEGLSVSAFIAKVLDDGLKRQPAKEVPPFRLVTVGGGGVRPGVDLDRIRELEIVDDESRFGGRKSES